MKKTSKRQPKNPNLKGYHIISNEEQFVSLFNFLAALADATSKSKGFDNSKTDLLVQIALIHSELGEATEAYRKDKMDNHIPDFTCAP